MWWLPGEIKEFHHSARDQAGSTAGHSGEWHVDGAELAGKQHNFRQHQRSRHISGHRLSDGDPHSYNDLYSDRNRTRGNNSIFNCGKRHYFRSQAHNCLERTTQHRCARRNRSSALDDNQCDFR